MPLPKFAAFNCQNANHDVIGQRKDWLVSSRWLIVSGLLARINGYRLLKLGGLAIIGCSVCM